MILRADWVLPVADPPLRRGAVRVAGGRIAAVGPADDVTAPGQPVIDLGAAALLPGLVNPHTHLELSAYAGRLAPGGFWTWLARLVDLRRAPGQVPREQQGVRDGAAQSLRAGVTCLGDISRRNLHWRVLKALPLRKVCFVELLSLADDPPRNPEELRAAVAEVAEDPLLTVGIAPHAPYTVPADQLRAAVSLADRLGRPWCVHWAETREECAFLRGDDRDLPPPIRGLPARCGVRTPRQSPVALLEACSRGLRPGTLAHVNYLEPGDAERLAAAGHAVVYCPRAHRFFGHPPHPYATLRAAGVTVAVGTDSLAANASLAPLEELRFLRQQTPDPPPPADLLRMVTLDAARALGLDAEIGTLEPGKAADLAAFPLPADAVDPAAALIDSAPPARAVWVAGAPALQAGPGPPAGTAE